MVRKSKNIFGQKKDVNDAPRWSGRGECLSAIDGVVRGFGKVEGQGRSHTTGGAESDEPGEMVLNESSHVSYVCALQLRYCARLRIHLECWLRDALLFVEGASCR